MRTRFLTLARLGLLALACSDDPSPVRLGGEAARLEISADVKMISLSRGAATLLTLPLDAFAIGLVGELDPNDAYDPHWLATNPPRNLSFESPTAAKLLKSSASSAQLELTFPSVTAALTIDAQAPGRFAAKLVPGPPTSGEIAFLRLRPRTSATEGFYGLGEWPDAVNHRGHLRPMQLEADLGLESANNENHVPVPLLIGTNGWGLFVESRRVGLFDVATRADDLVEITYGTAESSADGLAFHLFAAPHPLDVTRLYYDVTGDPLLPAPWALGPWIWRDENDDQAQVLEDAALIRTHDLATSGYWIDRPYASAVNTFDFNDATFPDPPAMIAGLHAAGLRVALWHTPYVEPSAGALRAEAENQGYFVPTASVRLNNWSTPIDFTNPAAFTWWQANIKRYIDLGIEGFKLDYGEDVIPSLVGSRNRWVFHDGRDERTMHHDYTLLYHQSYAETLPKTGGFLLCRAGRWGDQQHVSVIWPGDLDANLAKYGDPIPGDSMRYVGGLPTAVIQSLNLGPSGFPFYGSDTGGYRFSPPDRETFVRWFEHTALSTVMQVGNSASDVPWEFNAENGRDEESLGWYRTYARLHLRLFPYAWTYAKNLARDGRPLQRALGLAFPELGRHPDDEYLFGDSLLVAPVVERGRTTRTLTLPPGGWRDWWDGTRHEGAAGGSEIEVPAPLGRLPLFLRDGGIVPLLRPTIDTLAPATLAGIESYANEAGALWIRIAPGPTRTTFTVFDGTTIAQALAGDTLIAEYDSSASATFKAGAVLELLTGTATAVTLDGAPLAKAESAAAIAGGENGWFHEAAAVGGTTWVRVPAGRHVVTVKL